MKYGTGLGSKMIDPAFKFSDLYRPLSRMVFAEDVFNVNEVEGNDLYEGLIEIPEIARQQDSVLVGKITKVGPAPDEIQEWVGRFVCYTSLSGRVFGAVRILNMDSVQGFVDDAWVKEKLDGRAEKRPA
jgi:hypothetical protein